MNKFLSLSFLIIITFLFSSCSSDDTCPDMIIVNIDDPESIAQAEACGLSPAEPLGTIWVSEDYNE
ncbi:hypothetical protein GTQ40_05050 [Flavobacteriaceae bacterium R38]|nr:hypothetical protein [Flavobacteriaceae bacterium R38]